MGNKEVLEAFDQMDPRKAPSNDGLCGLFFRENWNVVGSDVLCYCNEMLNVDRSIREVNDTIVALIPKVVEPKDMFNYRSTNLCRVIYKIVVKVWDNRLKKFLPKCICQNQSAFVCSRMIHDNVLTAYELVTLSLEC